MREFGLFASIYPPLLNHKKDVALHFLYNDILPREQFNW